MIKDDLDVLYRNGSKHWLMAPAEKFALEVCILEAGPGDYLEIGVNRGGSLVFAGLVKRFLGQTGRTIGIEIAPACKPEIDKLAADYGTTAEVTYKPSDPWPISEHIEPVVAFIDGDHFKDAPMKDWNNLKDRTKRFILFHDCDEGSCVERAVENAKTESNWVFRGKSGNMAVFERCSTT